MAAWSFSAAIIYYLFCSLLIGGLTFQMREKVPETWEELLESNYTIAVPKNTQFHALLKVRSKFIET